MSDLIMMGVLAGSIGSVWLLLRWCSQEIETEQ